MIQLFNEIMLMKKREHTNKYISVEQSKSKGNNEIQLLIFHIKTLHIGSGDWGSNHLKNGKFKIYAQYIHIL